MELASHQINIEAARLLFSPALIAAAAAIWLVLTSGAAGHMVLRIEEISAGFRVPSRPPAPLPDTVPNERHEVASHRPKCPRSQAESQPVVGVDESDFFAEPGGSLLGPICLTPYLRIDPHTFELGVFRPSVSRARDERGIPRRHQFARRAPDDEELVLSGARRQPEQRHRQMVTAR